MQLESSTDDVPQRIERLWPLQMFWRAVRRRAATHQPRRRRLARRRRRAPCVVSHKQRLAREDEKEHAQISTRRTWISYYRVASRLALLRRPFFVLLHEYACRSRHIHRQIRRLPEEQQFTVTEQRERHMRAVHHSTRIDVIFIGLVVRR